MQDELLPATNRVLGDLSLHVEDSVDRVVLFSAAAISKDYEHTVYSIVLCNTVERGRVIIPLFSRGMKHMRSCATRNIMRDRNIKASLQIMSFDDILAPTEKLGYRSSF